MPDVTRAHITALMRDMGRVAVTANRVMACIRKMFNMAEVWGCRPDGSNPCRHVPKYKENGKMRYITNEELARLYAYLDSSVALSGGTYYNAWKRILDRANVPHVGTHDIRHHAATDIANSGVPLKVGMALTAHKTVSMFMTYVHTEDDPVRAAAEKVANLRQNTISRRASDDVDVAVPVVEEEAIPASKAVYRPFRHRKDQTRAVPAVVTLVRQ